MHLSNFSPRRLAGAAAIACAAALTPVAALAGTASPAAPVNLSGGRIGVPARWGNPGNAKLRTVRLAKGGTATAVLAITDVDVYPPNVCRQVTAAGLRVYPPNQFTSKLVPYPIRACSTKQIFMNAGVVQKR